MRGGHIRRFPRHKVVQKPEIRKNEKKQLDNRYIFNHHDGAENVQMVLDS